MTTFKDSINREWNISITVADIKRVNQRLGKRIDRMLDNDYQGMMEIVGDPITLVDVLYVLCESQCIERKMTDVEFGQLMHGDVIHEAADAFMNEFANFVPSQIKKPLMTLVKKGNELKAAAMAKVNEAVEKLESLNAGDLLTSAIHSPESSESIPTRTHGES